MNSGKEQIETHKYGDEVDAIIVVKCADKNALRRGMLWKVFLYDKEYIQNDTRKKKDIPVLMRHLCFCVCQPKHKACAHRHMAQIELTRHQDMLSSGSAVSILLLYRNKT